MTSREVFVALRDASVSLRFRCESCCVCGVLLVVALQFLRGGGGRRVEWADGRAVREGGMELFLRPGASAPTMCIGVWCLCLGCAGKGGGGLKKGCLREDVIPHEEPHPFASCC